MNEIAERLRKAFDESEFDPRRFEDYGLLLDAANYIEDVDVENEKLKALLFGLDEYLDRGTNQTAIYQGSKGHKEIKEALNNE